MDAILEAKFHELIDRHEVWSVLLRYARGLDRMDRDLLRSCYWDDAIDDHHGYVGSPDFFIDTTFGNTSALRVEHHGLSNHSCELDGDNAYCETHYTFIGTNEEPPSLLSIGRYIDHIQRRNGVWKFANRVTVIEKNFALTTHPGDAQYLAGDTRYGPLLPSKRDRSDLSYHRPVLPRRPLGD
jgi:SnoaL-like domain